MRKYLLLSLFLFFVTSCTTSYSGYKTSSRNIQVEKTVADEDSEIMNLLKPYKQKLETDMSRVLAVSDVEMIKDKPESNMTNFMADMLLETGKNFCRKNHLGLPDVSYVNYGGIRSAWPKGEINVRNVFELMPFENTMVFLKISGEKFREMAEIIAQRGGDGVAGMKLGIKDQKVSDLLINGNKFDPGKSYWIVTNDYIAGGGDKMDMFLNPESMVQSGVTIRDLIISYLEEKTKNGQHISAQKDGRIYYE